MFAMKIQVFFAVILNIVLRFKSKFVCIDMYVWLISIDIRIPYYSYAWFNRESLALVLTINNLQHTFRGILINVYQNGQTCMILENFFFAKIKV